MQSRVHVALAMRSNVIPFPRRPPNVKLAPSSVIGMLIFVAAELLLFWTFVAAFSRAHPHATWALAGQPWPRVALSALSSACLVASGLTMFLAGRAFGSVPGRTRRRLLATLVLGSTFVLSQLVQWASVLHADSALSSRRQLAFFSLIVGAHLLHAIAGLVAIGLAYGQLQSSRLSEARLSAMQVYWYFVVGVWPILYARLYF